MTERPKMLKLGKITKVELQFDERIQQPVRACVVFHTDDKKCHFWMYRDPLGIWSITSSVFCTHKDKTRDTLNPIFATTRAMISRALDMIPAEKLEEKYQHWLIQLQEVKDKEADRRYLERCKTIRELLPKYLTAEENTAVQTLSDDSLMQMFYVVQETFPDLLNRKRAR